MKLCLILALTFSIAQSAINVALDTTAVSGPIPCFFPLPCLSASNAIDGSILTLVTTMPGIKPFVSVDLGKAYQVTRVVISGEVGIPLATYGLGITNTDPNSVTPDPSNYNLCSDYVFLDIPLLPRTLFCPLNLYPRRWVIFQEIKQIVIPSILSLTEMEVYVAQKRATRYERSAGKRVVKDLALIGIPFTVAKRVDCMVACLKSEDCDSFNFRPSDNTCELHDWDKGVTPSTDIKDVPDWDLWQPAYAVTEQ